LQSRVTPITGLKSMGVIRSRNCRLVDDPVSFDTYGGCEQLVVGCGQDQP
jgi:hypothetical protein